MTFLQIVILAVIQGLAELLPVSSSAHVIAAAKLMGLDPSTPQFTMLLVMLHTGTMFAVIVYFWSAWKRAFFSTRMAFNRFAWRVFVATAATGVVAIILKTIIEHVIRHRHPGVGKAEVEELFKNMKLLSVSLAAAGVLILLSGLNSRRGGRERISTGDSLAIGAIQGVCLPFRGFSRSGATISLGLMRGIARTRVEEFSFALAVVLTPIAIWWEGKRLIQHHAAGSRLPLGVHDFVPSLIGMVFSFLAGLVALKFLSRLLEKGQWWVFGVYCLLASAGIYWISLRGY